MSTEYENLLDNKNRREIFQIISFPLATIVIVFLFVCCPSYAILNRIDAHSQTVQIEQLRIDYKCSKSEWLIPKVVEANQMIADRKYWNNKNWFCDILSSDKWDGVEFIKTR